MDPLPGVRGTWSELAEFHDDSVTPNDCCLQVRLEADVHCDFGNNRSRTFVEALYYCLHREHIEDEYRGEVNHLAYNCKIGHLLPLTETESLLTSIAVSLEDN